MNNWLWGKRPILRPALKVSRQPDTVVISAMTKRLVEGAFVLKDLGSHRLKGVPEPIAVAQVLNPIVTQSDEEEVGTGVVTTLVGRDEEIGLLLRRWEQSKEGFGQVVLINGEPGIGKSALADVIARTGSERRVYARHLPLFPLSYQQRALPGDHAPAALVALGA